MRTYTLLLSIAFFFGLAITAQAAPVSNIFRNILPETDNKYDIGSTSPAAQWLHVYATQLCIGTDCRTAWPTGGTGGSGTVGTSSAETAGRVPFWTTTAAGVALLSGGASGFLWDNTLGRLTATFASTTAVSASGNVWLTALGTPAGTILAVDGNGKIIATTTSAGGVTSVTGTYPVVSTGGGTPAISLAFGTTTSNTWAGTQTFSNTISVASLSGVIGGNSGTLYAVASSSLFGYTPLNPTRALTVAGTANQITSSAASQDLSADRTWTLSLPSLVIFPGQASTTQLSAGKAYFGLTATTTIDGTGNIVIPSGSGLTNTGRSDGCASWSSAVLTSTGVACGSGGGIADPFSHPAAGQSATTSLMLLFGQASTSQFTATSSVYLATSAGGVNIGTTSSFGKALFVEGATSGGVAVIQRDFNAVPASSAVGTYDVRLNETGAGSLANFTGPAQTFGVELGGGTENIQADTGSYRDGADTNGGFNVRTYFGGAPFTAIKADSGQRVGIASTTPYSRLSIHANTTDNTFTNTLFDIGSSTASATTTLFTVKNTGNVGIGTSTPMSLLSVVGNEDHWGSYYHFGSASPNAKCTTILGAQSCIELVGNDNTVGGVGMYVQNIAQGTSAYSGYNLLNDLSSTATTNFAGAYLTGSIYADTTYGTFDNVPSQLQLNNSMGPVSIASFASTTAYSYINFFAGSTTPGAGPSAANETARFTAGSGPRFGVGTTSPRAVASFNAPNTAPTENLIEASYSTGATNAATTTVFSIASSTNASLLIGTTTPANGSTSATSTIYMNKLQWQGANSAGATYCIFVNVAGALTTQLGLCN